VILDAYSRRVIGWALDRTLETKLTIAALEMALSRRRERRIHGSAPGERDPISMSRKGNPWDNAACESFIKTLK
jgi:putative transposase